MRIETSTKSNINVIEIEPTETIILSFKPDGVNSVPGSTRIELNISTLFLGDKMALSLFSTSPLYHNKTMEAEGKLNDSVYSNFFIIDDKNNADALEFKQYKLRLEKVG